MKKIFEKKEICGGIVISIFLMLVAILTAIFVVENDVISKASNDGWLGFLGGLFGSFISGIITFYVLYINRRDSEVAMQENKRETEKIQEENLKMSLKAQRLHRIIFQYQVNRQLVNDVMDLIAELINDVNRFYYHRSSNNNQYKEYKEHAFKLCHLIEMKLFDVPDGEKVIKQVKEYYEEWIDKEKCNISKDTSLIEEASKKLMESFNVFYKKYINDDEAFKEWDEKS